MAGTKSELGPTALAVAHAVKRHRERIGWSYAQLSRELTKAGRDIPPLGLGRVEAGDRRIDVDELTALAVVFGVSPASLLMPVPDDGQAGTPVRVTGTDAVPAQRAWSWLTGSYPLTGSVLSFYNDALPPWERDSVEQKLGGVRNDTVGQIETRTLEHQP